MADNEPSNFEIGQRIHQSYNPNRKGTIRYIGPVTDYSGTWIGVDWDDNDGKHDGSLNGCRYFNGRSDKSGSFVRSKNVSAGISFIEALLLRYRSNSTQEEEDEMYVLSTRNKRVSVQLVGKSKVEDKLKNFDELIGATLSYMGVSRIGDAREISALVPNLKLIDLTGNLLSKWEDINSLCEAIPALEVLNLTNNLLEHDIPALPSVKNIRILVLNHCGLTWEEVEKLKPSLPALQELHLMANQLVTIVPAPPAFSTNTMQNFSSLRLLNLENNCINSWDEIVKLSHLKSLEELHLNKNKIKHIFYPADNISESKLAQSAELHACSVPFQNLQCLLLGCNEIEDLLSIDSLNLFPSLVDIRLSDNPITDTAKGGIPRFVLIARLVKVKILNGSEISTRERRESEIRDQSCDGEICIAHSYERRAARHGVCAFLPCGAAHMKRYVRLVIGKLRSGDEEIKLHPRFLELKSVHGIDDEKPSNGPAGSQKMASGLVGITLKCIGASMGEKLPLMKKLPLSTTVGKLKVLCDSFFKLKGIKLRLFVEEEGSPLPQALEDDMDTLMDVGITSGCTILIDEEN